MAGASRSVNCLSTRVGKGSNAHVLESADAMRLKIVSTDTLLKEDISHMSSLLEREFVENVGDGVALAFSEKNSAN